jgi:hypothetical protein
MFAKGINRGLVIMYVIKAEQLSSNGLMDAMV